MPDSVLNVLGTLGSHSKVYVIQSVYYIFFLQEKETQNGGRGQGGAGVPICPSLESFPCFFHQAPLYNKVALN